MRKNRRKRLRKIEYQGQTYHYLVEAFAYEGIGLKIFKGKKLIREGLVDTDAVSPRFVVDIIRDLRES